MNKVLEYIINNNIEDANLIDWNSEKLNEDKKVISHCVLNENNNGLDVTTSEGILIPWEVDTKNTNQKYLIGEEYEGDILILPEDRIKNLLVDEKVTKKIRKVVDNYFSVLEDEKLNDRQKEIVVNYIKSLYEQKLKKEIPSVEPYLTSLHLDMYSPDFFDSWVIADIRDDKALKKVLNLQLKLTKKLSRKIEKKLDVAFKIRESKKKYILKKILRKIEKIAKKIKSMIKELLKEGKNEYNKRIHNENHLYINRETASKIKQNKKENVRENKKEVLHCINKQKENVLDMSI